MVGKGDEDCVLASSDGKVIGELHYNHMGRRWVASLSVDPTLEYQGLGSLSHSFNARDFQIISRLIACHVEGDHERLSRIQRGFWVSPCPTCEVIPFDRALGENHGS